MSRLGVFVCCLSFSKVSFSVIDPLIKTRLSYRPMSRRSRRQEYPTRTHLACSPSFARFSVRSPFLRRIFTPRTRKIWNVTERARFTVARHHERRLTSHSGRDHYRFLLSGVAGRFPDRVHRRTTYQLVHTKVHLLERVQKISNIPTRHDLPTRNAFSSTMQRNLRDTLFHRVTHSRPFQRVRIAVSTAYSCTHIWIRVVSFIKVTGGYRVNLRILCNRSTMVVSWNRN